MRVYVAGPVTGRPRRNLATRLDMDVRELSRWTG